MSDIFNSYIPKYLITLNRQNEDVITVSTKYLSPTGDTYVVDRKIILPSVLPTQESIGELQPEISNEYPFVTVTPLDYDSSSIIQSPSLTTKPTASQGYYIPIYFERYEPAVIGQLVKDFTELVNTVE